jgi:flavin-dependent dehydrogenase
MPQANHPELSLQDGSRVAVVGGGPAGSFFSFFLLEMAKTVGLDLQVVIYEPRNFAQPGPGGCNMCGGIVSESLVQNLATEGITLGPDVVQRSIDSYCLHMDVGDVRIATPLREKRIASVHRGGGPRGVKEIKAGGLDEHLLQLAIGEGAERRRERVDGLDWDEGRPRIKTQSGTQATYDLLVVAVGCNSPALRLFESALPSYKAPVSTKTYICEFLFGRDMIKREFGSAMHVFLLNIPRLEFAALIPKGDYVTFCMLGHDIDKGLVQQVINSRELRQTLPPNWTPPPDFCHCSPKISVDSAVQPFADRVVFVGDCGTTRLYKDGIGAAYRTSKAAARTVVFHGVAADDFRRHYWPVCKKIEGDNRIGKLVFAVTRLIQNTAFARRGLWRMVSKEQINSRERRMSTVLWDTFTGSAPYRDVLVRTLHPAFIGRFAYEMLQGARRARGPSD